jgi:iron(III) transport system substrate-binding protein
VRARHLLRHRTLAATAAATLLLATACAPPDAPEQSGDTTTASVTDAGQSSASSGGSAGGDASSTAAGSGSAGAGGGSSSAPAGSDFSLDDLVAAAKAEGSLTVYDTSGIVKDLTANFEKEYGIKTTGVKSSDGDTITKMVAEGKSGNVTVDVALLSDVSVIVSQLIPQKTADSWVPPDLAGDIDEQDQHPLVESYGADLWAYNTEAFPDGCPLTNVWDVADPAWKGKVYLEDPLDWSKFTDMLTSFAVGHNDELTAAYQDKYGKDLPGDAQDATHLWLKMLAGNDPRLVDSSEDAAAAIGTPGQGKDAAPVGLISLGKFRDNEDKGYKLGFCKEMKPWGGIATPKDVVIATGTTHPNAAKLYVHYILTQEGIQPVLDDSGALSANNSVTVASDTWPEGLTDWKTQLLSINVGDDVLRQAFAQRQDWQDFWRLNHH